MKAKKNLKKYSLKNKLIIALLCFAVLGGFFVYQLVDTQPKVTSELQTQVYTGTLPCADCPGIETKLRFTFETADQGTYMLESMYIDRNDNKPLVTKGIWKIEKGTPSDPQAKVYALDYTDPGLTNYFLQIDENHIVQLDNAKNKIDSPFDMTLTKQN